MQNSQVLLVDGCVFFSKYSACDCVIAFLSDGVLFAGFFWFACSSGELTSFAGRDAIESEAPDSEDPVLKENALLFSPSAICTDPLSPHNVLVCTDDVQKCVRRLSADGSLLVVVCVHSFNISISSQRPAFVFAFLRPGYVTTLAGRIAGDPHEDDTEAFKAWQIAHRASVAVGLDAVFSDISGATFGILNNESDPLVYVACMESGCVKSIDPRTRTITSFSFITRAFCLHFMLLDFFFSSTYLSDEVRRLIGTESAFGLKTPFNLAIDSMGRLVISCLEDNTIMRFDPSATADSQLQCLAGQSGQQGFVDGNGRTEALLGDVSGIAIDPWDTVFFADYSHGAIRALAPNGMCRAN